jgi:hypothetical protein
MPFLVILGFGAVLYGMAATRSSGASAWARDRDRPRTGTEER